MPVEAPRALAFEVLRQTFEHGAHTELAFRAGAERLGLVGRDRAQAQRLAYGSVQRRGTSDAAIERLAGRAMHLLDPQVAAALRLGLYELLFADGTPDHAAVGDVRHLLPGHRDPLVSQPPDHLAGPGDPALPDPRGLRGQLGVGRVEQVAEQVHAVPLEPAR